MAGERPQAGLPQGTVGKGRSPILWENTGEPLPRRLPRSRWMLRGSSPRSRQRPRLSCRGRPAGRSWGPQSGQRGPSPGAVGQSQVGRKRQQVREHRWPARGLRAQPHHHQPAQQTAPHAQRPPGSQALRPASEARRPQGRPPPPPTEPWGCCHPSLTWNMARLSLGVVAGWGVVATLASPESHSCMVTILRGGRCRWVSRAFLRWWKSPSVRVYLRGAPTRTLLHAAGPRQRPSPSVTSRPSLDRGCAGLTCGPCPGPSGSAQTGRPR